MGEIRPNIASTGLNLNSIMSQIPEGSLTYALNAQIEGFDGNVVTYQNEQKNTLCVTIPDGYKVIGIKNILQLERVVFFITNPTTKDSQIGFANHNDCKYVTLITDKGNPCKFNFSIDHPIHKVIVKTTNCATQIYWTDDYNPRRYIDLDDLPWVETIDPTNDYKRIKQVGKLDCNKLNVQPSFSIPEIEGVEVTVGGSLTTGVYQFAVQYANSLGDGLTSFYNVSNPISIFEARETESFDLPSSRAITVRVNNLDKTGLYEFFNIVVIRTVNNISTPEFVGTFPIADDDYVHTYTGTTQTEKRLNIEDIFQKFPYYDIAGDIFEVDNVLGWGILREQEDINYQKVWANVVLQWETAKIPYNQFQAYSNGLNSERYRGYMRDEVYALEGCFVLKNGKQTKSFPIPGRKATSYDKELIDVLNKDNAFSTTDKCDPPVQKPRWEVYNTANLIGQLFLPDENDCYIGPYQYGEFGYWESTEKYPNNPDIWGDLANQPIRHHRFPDLLVSPIHDNNTTNIQSFEHSIFPIGVRVDSNSLYAALMGSGLTQEQIANIAEFKIVRGNRVNNKSIIAKGILHNVGTTTYEDRTYLYPNYPLNDLRPDPYYANEKLGVHEGFAPEKSLVGFVTDTSKKTYTFHSPDTHFYQPFLDNSGEFLKIETIEYGKSLGHFVKVKDNAEYKFLTRKTIYAAAGMGLASGVTIAAGMFGWPTFSMAPIGPTYNAMTELFEKIVPYSNFGYSFNQVGNYSNSFPVPNDGNKQRAVVFNKYVIDGINSIDQGKQLNNIRRESSVYVATNDTLPFPHEYDNSIPEENSRYNLASRGDDLSPETFRESDIASYYGSLKRTIVNQWGRIHSYEVIDTGFNHKLFDDKGDRYTEFPAVFGGDIFINRFAYKSKIPFFRDNTVMENNQTDVQYDEDGTLNWPMFWISTKPARFDIDIDDEVNDVVDEFFNPSFFDIIANIFGGGAKGSVKAMNLIRKLFSEIYDKIGIKNINLDRAQAEQLYERGIMYLFAYGIPHFFCESEVNVDYRQATNAREGNFYPNVGGDVPDDWLQENNVTIAFDNIYHYNKTYSKQNKENFFSHLRENFDPSKPCTTNFPNRAIWSDKSTLEETKNNWLVYKPLARYDFPKSHGALVALDGIENRQVLVRFENKSQLYNALLTAPTSAMEVYLGQSLFQSNVPPLDYGDTELGFIGSQHKFLLKTEFGHIIVDAIRGGVYLINGKGFTNLSEIGAEAFFSQELPFKILEKFPGFFIDNHFKGIGLHGVYDSEFKRFILTKLDYQVIDDRIAYNEGKFYLGAKEVFPEDTRYFCDQSFTISFSFKTRTWISFHSYLPNFYSGSTDLFYSGINYPAASMWAHNISPTRYNNFYGKIEPYILEYPFSYKNEDEILQSVKDYTKVNRYLDDVRFVQTNDRYFTKSMIWNDQQFSGVMKLTHKAKNNLSLYLKYPKFNADNREILFTKTDNFYTYNGIFDTVKDYNQPIFEPSCTSLSQPTIPDSDNVDYGVRSFKKYQIRAKDCRIRHILDDTDEYRFISQFILTNTQKSYK